MRPLQAVLIAVGVTAGLASAAAGPAKDSRSAPTTVEKYEWSMSKGRLGVMVMSLTPELRAHLGAAPDRGVLVARVESGSPAAAAGIAVGDVIVEVRGKPIDDASDVLAVLADVRGGSKVAVQIVRDKQPVSVSVTMAGERQAAASENDWSHWLHEMMKPFDVPPPRS